ncbi:hypothetical protein J7I80_03705 [Bacillus sp. ISL-41]|uniref:CBO0543 family protein n=1 Tax=Bacillus sp. ISL-41 TaxID=2819127 RepID=UPI001BE96D45|nr:CBO0543 family protein [Bacillus sp. ISL-41]MBT2641334.1 hypothetical protein [Bacillus sp. ISL-41]
MYLAIAVAVILILAYFLVDWKRWENFYPTIQFYIICNLMYNFLFYNHTLWAYKPKSPWLNHTFIDLAFSLIIIPIVLMIYLNHIPKMPKNTLFYLAVWVTAFTVVEYFFQRTGMFIYDNGWGIIHSAIFNVIMFSVLGIHYKRPLYGILLSIPIIAILLFFHHPSFGDLK